MATALEMNHQDWRRFNPARNLAVPYTQRDFLEEHRRKALEVAKQASFLLRQQFGAEKVVLFGSLANKEAFTRWSDIDLAASGIAPGEFYLAVAAVTGLSPAFKIDLVELEACRDRIKNAIKTQGIEI